MTKEQQPVEFVAIQECCAGNSEVGTMWLETGTFPPTATLAEVWAWGTARTSSGGRLMVRPNITATAPETEKP